MGYIRAAFWLISLISGGAKSLHGSANKGLKRNFVKQVSQNPKKLEKLISSLDMKISSFSVNKSISFYELETLLTETKYVGKFEVLYYKEIDAYNFLVMTECEDN